MKDNERRIPPQIAEINRVNEKISAGVTALIVLYLIVKLLGG